ncbi:MAG TPA: glycosyltransferase [Verrucomicrobiae bacterium]|nr:glycosyltransferase [Verrucomicrobiae bacterium]
MSFSIIIPAFNEENYLVRTLDHINQAAAYLRDKEDQSIEIIVVDNNSTDQTACVARDLGATVLSEFEHNISRVRNTGARAANGDILIFVDADTLVPENLLWRISQAMSDPACAGGSVDTDYQPVRFSLKVYLQLWRILGNLARMAQGATQFCRRSIYSSLGGYDERFYMGEDVDFYWRLKRLAKEQNKKVCCLSDLRVTPSCRRFDQWPLWKILIWTNPMVVLLLQRRRGAWHGWYQAPLR